MPIADTLLRLAEHDPPFFVPKWSKDILEETQRTLVKFGYSAEQAKRRIDVMQEAFPEALVTGYEIFVDTMKNDPKDRHVLAAAVRAKADCIVTDNGKHFPKTILEPLDLDCLTGESFLVEQYLLDPDSFTVVLTEQAMNTGRSLAELVGLLSKYAPKLAVLVKA
jgi:predicted nucleic acid-binding protein